jgi:hypothetical protein
MRAKNYLEIITDKLIPIVTYASETWVLKETTIQKMLIFERKILRKSNMEN